MYTVNGLTEIVMNLTEQEQQKLFQLVTDNAELLIKVMPDMPLLQHIMNNTESDNQLIQSYSSWKNNT